ncbi:Phosphatidylcholine--sterol O-acyltransferase [Bertholletia excelsa]
MLVSGEQQLHPLILVPGNGGNQLEARLTAASTRPQAYSARGATRLTRTGGLVRLWFDLTVLFAPYTRCFAHRMMLYYDSAVDDYRNAPGVETRAPHFGSTKALLYLNPCLKVITSYMAPLVKSLEHIGYVDGETLFGAPYDFRYLGSRRPPEPRGIQVSSRPESLNRKASASNGGKPSNPRLPRLGLSFSTCSTEIRRPGGKNLSNFRCDLRPMGRHGGADAHIRLRERVEGLWSLSLLVREEQRSSESNLCLCPIPKRSDGENRL